MMLIGVNTCVVISHSLRSPVQILLSVVEELTTYMRDTDSTRTSTLLHHDHEGHCQ